MVSVICFKTFYYIETDELNTRNFPFTKKSYPHRAVKILFLSFTCEDIGVAMVTNMISQLQERFPLRRPAGSFEISFTKWFRGAKTIQLPVTLSMSCQIFTSILFPSLKNIQEDLPKTDLVSPRGHAISSIYIYIYNFFFINDFNHFFI